MQKLTENRTSVRHQPVKPHLWLTFIFEKLWLPLAGMAFDAFLISAAFYFAHTLRFGFLAQLLPPPAFQPFYVISSNFYAILPVWLMVFFYSAKLYDDLAVKPEDLFARALHGCLLSVIFSFALTFLLKNFEQSRLVYALTLPLATIFVFSGNMVLRKVRALVLRHIGPVKTVLVAGQGKSAEAVLSALGKGTFCRALSANPSDKNLLFDAVAAEDVDTVVLANASFDKADIVDVADRLEQLGVELFIVPGMVELRLGEVQFNQAFGLPVMRIYHTSFSGSNYWFKRCFDLLFCALIALFGFMPFLLVALLIKLESPGPVLYRQKRYGYKGSVFYAFKFRTMYKDAEARVAQMRAQAEQDGPYFKVKNDPRITPLGKWLRRLSIDEFPQFLNVVLGEMSVVGPRPLAVSSGEKEALEAEYGKDAVKTFNVLPGITGLWQVSGRSDLGDDQRFALDLYYIEHWSLGLDLKIILKTPFAMVSSRGAY